MPELSPVPAAAAIVASPATPSTPSVSPALPRPDPFAALFEILWRRRVLALSLFACTVLAVVVLTVLSPKQYTTHVKFIAGSAGAAPANATTSGGTGLPVLNAMLAASQTQSAETYAEMLRETPAAANVVKELQIPMSPGRLLSHVTVKPVTNTAIIDVGVTWSDPRTSAKLANALAGSFVDLRRNLIADQANGAIEELNRQLPDAEKAMRSTAGTLSAYEARTGIADAQLQTVNVLGVANQLDARLAQVQVDQRQAEASLSAIQGQLARTPATVSGGGSVQPNPVAAQLRAQLAQVGVQLRTAREQYTDAHPTVQNLRAQEKQLTDELARQPATVVASTATIANPLYQQLSQQAAQLRAQARGDAAQIATLRGQRTAAERGIRALPQDLQRLADLKRQATLSENVYNALRQKLNEAQIAKTTALSDVAVIQPARADDNSVSPNLILNTLIAIVLGLILGVTGALGIDRLDGTIKDESEVEERLGLPLLGTFPALGSSSRPPAPWVQTVMIESVFHLVTSLRYASSNELRTIAFTSAQQGEGKSMMALNAAIGLAELRTRVLLVDADLRLASLHKKLEMENERGLSDILVGSARIDDVVKPTKHGGLDIITSGTRSPNPLRLLRSEAFAQFLEDAKSRYGVVILDASAAASVTDAAVVCGMCDGSVLVLARGQTDIRLASRVIAKLQTAGVRNVLGAVLNRVEPRRSEIGAYGEVVSDGARVFPLPPARSA